jgi:hypothetical protein
MSGQLHAPGKEVTVTHWVGGQGGPQSRSGRYEEEKILASTGNRCDPTQSVDHRYTTQLKSVSVLLNIGLRLRFAQIWHVSIPQELT